MITVSSFMHRRVKTVPWDDLAGERGYRSQDSYTAHGSSPLASDGERCCNGC